jgi:cytochrome c peroxidase
MVEFYRRLAASYDSTAMSRPRRPVSWLAALVLAIAALAGTDTRVTQLASATSGPLSRADATARAAALSMLGRQMFSDPSLSASGGMSCATCHDPRRAFGPSNTGAVQRGGTLPALAGHRAVPSLMYLQSVPPFTEHFFESDDEGDSSVDNGPTGGLTWDGRVDRARDQARLPLLSPYEMANATPADVAARVAQASYAPEFLRLFGPRSLGDPGLALAGVTMALEAFEQDVATFSPYSSKYDDYLEGRTRLSAAEQRGLEAFENRAKGNCASCHVSRPAPNGARPQFTDYGLVALGLPRNPAILANADPNYHDLGLCGPDRTDLSGRADYCGRFMTPTLRNVATRTVFFHNGVVRGLREAVAFYAERDVNPEKWYPRDPRGQVRKFDDLPPVYWRNVEIDPPFGPRPGLPPVLSPQDLDDIVAFLGTLTDRPVR